MAIFIAGIVLILLLHKISLGLMKKYVRTKHFCGIVMPSEKDKAL